MQSSLLTVAVRQTSEIVHIAQLQSYINECHLLNRSHLEPNYGYAKVRSIIHYSRDSSRSIKFTIQTFQRNMETKTKNSTFQKMSPKKTF